MNASERLIEVAANYESHASPLVKNGRGFYADAIAADLAFLRSLAGSLREPSAPPLDLDAEMAQWLLDCTNLWHRENVLIGASVPEGIRSRRRHKIEKQLRAWAGSLSQQEPKNG